MVVNFAVTGEFGAAHGTSPVLTGGQQSFGYAGFTMTFRNINAFKETDRACFAAFHIIMPQMTLGETDGRLIFEGQEAHRIFGFGQNSELRFKFSRIMRPHAAGKLCKNKVVG